MSGSRLARASRVSKVEWDPDDDTLTGSVVGNGAVYQTTAYFMADCRGALVFDDGECTAGGRRLLARLMRPGARGGLGQRVAVVGHGH